MRLAVIDTNVVVSGVLAGEGPSPNGRIVDAMASGRLRHALSEALLAEYRRVLLRPAIARRHGLSASEVDGLLEDLVMNAVIVAPPAPGEPRSSSAGAARRPVVPGDERVIALLEAVPGAILVTGDLRLRDAVTPRWGAVSPADFAAPLD